MRKTMLSFALALLLAVSPLSMSQAAVSEITAHINPEIQVVLNGQKITFAMKGDILPSILYQGVTYVPLSALAQALDLPASWDQASATWNLGSQPGGVSLINDIAPYATSHENWFKIVQAQPGREHEVAGKSVDSYISIYVSHFANYNLGGKFSTLTFQSYSENDSKILFFGDNDALLGEARLRAKNLPITTTIDVSNVIQLKIMGDSTGTSYIFDAYLE